MGMLGVLQTVVRAIRDEEQRYLVADRVAQRIHPHAILSERERYWLYDQEFRAAFRRFEQRDLRRMDRAWMIGQMTEHAIDVPGDTVECGVFRGLMSYLICQRIVGSGKRHHCFDSFEGLSDPGTEDGHFWTSGVLAASENEVRSNLADFDFVDYHAGWIPDRFPDVDDRRFSLVHIDVDLHQPTADSIEFFYPRLSPGGVMILDDYGFRTCPGARHAADAFAADNGVNIIECSTGQGLVFRNF